MDFKKYEYNREQKKGYQMFTKDALIDIIIRKNELIAGLQTKLLDLHNVSGSASANKCTCGKCTGLLDIESYYED